MRSVEDKSCYNQGPIQEISSTSNGISFEFHKGNRNSHHRMALGKPTPSKWDDAQKWLVGLSRGGDKSNSSQPRNSNADDRRLIAPVPLQEQDYSSVECDDSSIWRINRPVNSSASSIRSICVRDMGTEMTPIGSQEPSRTATPIRAGTPVARSPISSPIRCQHGLQSTQAGSKIPENENLEESKIPNPLETRAMAWDEAEQAKYMARYKREEVKIQACENHEKRKAEMEMKKLEVKAERMKARAQEKLASKLASTKRKAEEKRANAEAKLSEKAVRTAERADYIRRTGHLPSSFSFKLPSICW